MSTVLTWQTSSISSEQTELLGERLGKLLKGGEIIELVSDLGGGKTTFTRGLVRGAGSLDKVASPSFTISKLYVTDNFEIHHFDFYRLDEAGIVAHELQEVAGDPTTVVIVEWADVVQHVLPANRLTITIQQTADGDRELTFTAPESYTTIIETLQNA